MDAAGARETVRELEAALATTRGTVQQLQAALESREADIAGLRQMLTSTKKERDELRVQNAELINKLAIVGRKQSTSSPPKNIPRSTLPPESPTNQSPVIQRRNSKVGSPLPPLPPPPPPVDTPPTPTNPPTAAVATNEGSDTDYSDMEEEETMEKKIEKREKRSKSPESPLKDYTGPQQRFSRPKTVVRSLPTITTTSAPGAGSPVKITSPKKSVAFPPAQNLSSIFEEEGGGSPGQIRPGGATTKITSTGKERIPSDSGSDGSRVFGGAGGEGDEANHPRRRVTMSMTDFKKKSLSQDPPSEDDGEVEAKKDNFEMRRSRTSTISSSSGGSYKKEHKRRSSKQLREAAAKCERSPDFISGGRKLHRLELFSPDMELRIREKICSAIGKKYGGLTRANKSAIVIQSAYRQYKLREQYNKIRKEASEVRQRAQSMKDPRRRPSMIRKNRPRRYDNRNLSALAPSTDPLLKAKLLSQDIGRAGVPHTHTSSRRQLVEKVRSERSLSEGRMPAPEPTKLSFSSVVSAQESQDGVVEMETVVCEISIEDEATPTVCLDPAPNSESTDSSSLPTSFSTDVLLTPSGYERPLSIFSPSRPASSIEISSLGPRHISRGEEEVIKSLSQRPLSPEVRDRKINMGIGHFNRKPTRGIQYLVREKVLPDTPQKVATFLASQYGLSKEKIGEFVGEISSEFHMAVLECLLEQMDMKSKPIDEALRGFQILFRMPGEAQKIDKIMQIFALEYYRFNKDRVIKSEDAAYILSFAIMMLHTALHNPSVKNRTTKKQWVSMNRGVNDGDNFPEQFLLDIYDRIGKREFTTGQDHTTEVCDIERNLVGYQKSSRLAIPQRRLICRAVVTEINQLTSRPSFKNKRRRLMLVFSDQVIICKKRGGDQLEYRGSFSLMDAFAISFETHHYRNGIQIHSSHDAKAIFQCNCDASDERVKLLGTLEATINELRELEKERIAELGSSVGKQQDVEPDRRRRMASRAGDLMSSAQLEKPLASVRRSRESKGDYVQGVGDLVTSSSTKIIRRTSRSSGTSSQPENRTSGGSHESGYDSQRTTPVPSPSPTNPPHSTPHYSTSTPPYSSMTVHPTPPPMSKRQLIPRVSTTSAPMTLMTPGTPVTRSKSTDQIHRVMRITPTLKRDTRGMFSSAEDLHDSPKSSASNSPRPKKKKEHTKTTSGERKRLNFSPFRRSNNNSNNNRRGSSPVPGIGGSPVMLTRSRAVSETPSLPPPNDIELSTRSVGRVASYIVNT